MKSYWDTQTKKQEGLSTRKSFLFTSLNRGSSYRSFTTPTLDLHLTRPSLERENWWYTMTESMNTGHTNPSMTPGDFISGETYKFIQ